jgi:hypothetical protein
MMSRVFVATAMSSSFVGTVYSREELDALVDRLRMTGYSEAELRSLTPVDITHEDDRASTEAIMAAQLVGQPYVQHRRSAIDAKMAA